MDRQTRPHSDLDLAVDAAHLDPALQSLASAGFAVVVDWLPVRIELKHPDGRTVDVHPVVLLPSGAGEQQGFDGTAFVYSADCWSSGLIGGERVPCLSAQQQIAFRQGYDARSVDVHDLALLAPLASPPC